MGFFDVLNNISSGVSSVGSILGGTKAALGLFSNPQASLFNYQKKMMDYQNRINRENSLLDYQRQRQLTKDQFSLNKIGMRQAGINTAFSDGSSVGAASVGSTDGVSVPSPLPSAASIDSQYMDMINSIGTAANQNSTTSAQNAVSMAQEHLLKSQARSQDIKNAFEIDRQIAELEQLHKSNKISDAEYGTRMENLKRLQDTHASFVTQEDEKAKQSEIQTKITEIQRQQEEVKKDILSVTKDMNEEQLKQLRFITEHQFEKFAKDMEEQNSRIAANKASAAASYASAAASRAQAMYTDTLNALEKAKVPYADRLARAVCDQARNAATLTFNQAIGAGLDNAPKAREAQYQNYIKGEENSWIGRNILYNMRGVFDNSLGNLLHIGK